MQYAVMNGPDNLEFLIDTNELVSFQKAMESGDSSLFMNEKMPDEKSMHYKIAYGVYIPQSHFKKNEIKQQINDALGVWLVHFNDNQCIFMEIEDIKIHEAIIVKPIEQKLKKTNEVAFSALLKVPENIKLGTDQTQALTAFVRYFDKMDPISNLLHRPGIFAFKSEEKYLGYQTLSHENWKRFANPKRAIQAAQKTF